MSIWDHQKPLEPSISIGTIIVIESHHTFETNRNHWEPSIFIWIHQKPLGAIDIHLKPSGAINILWNHQKPLGAINIHLEPSESIGSHQYYFGAIRSTWSHQYLFKTLRNPWEPSIFIWNHHKPQGAIIHLKPPETNGSPQYSLGSIRNHW